MAFAEMTKKYIEGAVGSETQNAVQNWGLTYSSNHEGYAVLKEEVDEARDEYIQINNNLYKLWNGIRFDNLKKENVEEIKKHAEQLALEACQVAAVCNKILNGLKNEETETGTGKN